MHTRKYTRAQVRVVHKRTICANVTKHCAETIRSPKHVVSVFRSYTESTFSLLSFIQYCRILSNNTHGLKNKLLLIRLCKHSLTKHMIGKHTRTPTVIARNRVNASFRCVLFIVNKPQGHKVRTPCSAFKGATICVYLSCHACPICKRMFYRKKNGGARWKGHAFAFTPTNFAGRQS